MRLLRFFLFIANAGASLVLLAIPIGKLCGLVEEEIDAAAVYGWLMYFTPLFASALGLWGVYFSKPVLTRPFVIIAMPGSFLMAFVSVFIFSQGSSNFMQIGVGAAVLLGLNVLALWEPFKAHLESSANRAP